AMNVSAFRNEITLCEQARALFPQKALDRFGSRLMRTNVNVAELFRHAPINSPALEGNSNFARATLTPALFLPDVFGHLILQNLQWQCSIFQHRVVKLALIEFVAEFQLGAGA